jgi:hypothetical protein
MLTGELVDNLEGSEVLLQLLETGLGDNQKLLLLVEDDGIVNLVVYGDALAGQQ